MKIATVKSDGLNIREFNNAKSKSLDELTHGDKLEVEKTVGEWAFGKVIYTRSGKGVGKLGWFNTKYATVTQIPEFPHLPELLPEAPSWRWWAAVFAGGAIVILVLMYT